MVRHPLNFKGEGILTPRTSPKLQDNPMSAVRDCLSSTSYLASKSGDLLHPQSEGVPCLVTLTQVAKSLKQA
jgi:hypothetical protein